MPEQPPDPLHYEMKIPPDRKETSNAPQSGQPAQSDSAPITNSAKMDNVARGDDKTQNGSTDS